MAVAVDVVTDKTKMPPNCKSFLRDNDNKTQLLGFPADKIVMCPDSVMTVTKEDVLCNKPYSLEGLSLCNYEEADWLRPVTDIFGVAISVFVSLQDAGLEEVWTEFGQKKSCGILFFQSSTGCDVVSAFCGKGRKTAWQTWEVCPEVSSVFQKA